MRRFLSRRRLGIFRVVFASVEGVAIGLAVKAPIVSMVYFCIIVTAIRLRLEARLP
jgi:hypothetical protein